MTTPVIPAASHSPIVVSYDPEAFEVPTGREEGWRFTPLARLRGLHSDAESTSELEVVADQVSGATVEQVERDDSRLASDWRPSDRVAARAWAGFERATLVTVDADADLIDPVIVRLHGVGGTAFGHVRVSVGRAARATVVLEHTGSATYAGNVDVSLDDDAQLTLISVQNWDDDAVHLGHQHLGLGRNARVESIVVTLGGDLIRLRPAVTYRGPGGEADLFGMYFADAGQHQEHRLFVDHSVPNCRSNVLYKGALQGEGAHAVWIGDVLIQAKATGTDTYEINRNLVLTDGARADSVPNLEIETGEVAGAGHASTTGRFDDEQLFYLMSRGISAEEAKRLVVWGFFGEILQRIKVDEVREALESALEDEIAGGVSAGEIA